MQEAWNGFIEGKWSDSGVHVRNFIQKNYTPYYEDASFLQGPTDNTIELWKRVSDLNKQERDNMSLLEQIKFKSCSRFVAYLQSKLVK